MLPDPFTARSKNNGHLGTFHGHQFFLTLHIHSNIFGFLSCFFYSFSVQILLLLAAFFGCRGCAFSCCCLLLLPTSLLLLAFLLLLGCHKLVSDYMAHGHQNSTDIQLLKLPHFWKVAETTAIWYSW
jgi:hypothetical protein